MDLEAPIDGWYVFIAISMVTLSITGLVLAVPREPPPDATRAANTIDGVAGSNYEAHDTVRHDAEEVKMYGRQISFRNEHGTTHQEIAFGQAVLVNEHEELESIAWGADLEEHYPAFGHSMGHGAGTQALVEDIEDHRAKKHGNWTQAYGELTVRTISWTGDDIDPRNLGGIRNWITSLIQNCSYTDIATLNCYSTPEELRQKIADENDWLRYDAAHNRFYATLVVA